MSKINNKMSNHIDKSVIRLFIIAFLISASVLAYRYTKYTPCKEVVFAVTSDDFRESKLVKFTDNTANAKVWKWNFGDSSKEVFSKEALHIYKKPGEYYVKLTVNDICERIEKVVIKQKIFVIDSTKLPIFKLPNSILVGEKLTVIDKTPNASTWEWRFGETANINSKERIAKYTYKESGLKTVSLIVNGDVQHMIKKRINVLPIEQEDERINDITAVQRTVDDGIKDKPLDAMDSNGAPKSVPFISESQFKNNLILVSKKKMSVNSFKKYLCGDLNKSIIVNGKKTSFLAFCELIKDKKLKIKEVKLYRDKGSNCIKDVTIVRKKFIF
ncbi:PKD domain-containing protein [Tenacibaculum sp.]|nr:PKD domain-containing protein [Tenacibaculum sp.]